MKERKETLERVKLWAIELEDNKDIVESLLTLYRVIEIITGVKTW